jgi:hypothetical protein
LWPGHITLHSRRAYLALPETAVTDAVVTLLGVVDTELDSYVT